MAAVAPAPAPASASAPAPAPAPAAAAAAAAAPPASTEPDLLHPALWRAHQLGRQREAGVASGWAELDAELPGGGWPARALTELLLPHPGIGELRLLAPALAAVQRSGRCVMWFDPPARPAAWTLAALGLDLSRLVIVQRRDGCQGPARERLPAADVLWALEQSLKSGHVGAVVAWLPPRVRPEALRRLQLAAQAHDGPAFVLRELQAQARPSAAPLRLRLGPGGLDVLTLHLLKRRGPPPLHPLQLGLHPVLSASQQARAQRLAAAEAPLGEALGVGGGAGGDDGGNAGGGEEGALGAFAHAPAGPFIGRGGASAARPAAPAR